MEKQKIVIICGPTGSGKSGTAFNLCQELNGAIISADSRQIYKGMDIGTGKELNTKDVVVEKENDHYRVNGIDIYGYDIVSPNEEFSVSIFEDIVLKDYIPPILRKGKVLFLVGGTGFYIKSIIDGIETSNIPPNPQLRDKLENIYKKKGIEALWQLLQKEDPDKARTIDSKNPRRIIRAIEIAKAREKGWITKLPNQNFEPLFIGINWERKELYERVDKRIDEMVNHGLVLEISKLIHRGYTWDLPALNTIGYIELKPFLEEKGTLASCVERLKFNTHAYIRRQLTWFNKDKRIKWFEMSNNDVKTNIIAEIERFMSK